jgi:hypothetical protein
VVSTVTLDGESKDYPSTYIPDTDWWINFNTSAGDVKVRIVNTAARSSELILYYAGLYPGAYTASELDTDQPMDFGAELADSQRYYLRINGAIGSGYTSLGGGVAYIICNTPSTMRSIPSIKFNGTISIRYGGNVLVVDHSAVTVDGIYNHAVVLKITHSQILAKYACSCFVESGVLELDANMPL